MEFFGKLRIPAFPRGQHPLFFQPSLFCLLTCWRATSAEAKSPKWPKWAERKGMGSFKHLF